MSKWNNALNEIAVGPEEKELLLMHEKIPDDVLETAGNERANTFSQWICTALDFCPSPWRTRCVACK
jgi:hypothetical protein